MLLLRGVGGLVLPATMVVGARGRRRRAGAPALEEVADPVPEERRPRPGRRELQRIGADLDRLAELDLRGADLRGLPLAGADLTGLDLRHARLRRTVLRETCFAYAALDYADLSGADLRGADLTGTSLLEADLCGADLRGVDLRATRQLAMANLRQIRSDRTTKWPQGFAPVTDGALHP
ncbi:MAG TPA: pentapeptide repeat-containing protein [Acidimicrobiales bacterium]|nr:pentapeptide repeat-containing protein [Acidimicrobiales bacterium]